jgi:pyruvate dehydrogenase kinase 2/3/4
MIAANAMKQPVMRVKPARIHPLSLKQLYSYDPKHYFLKVELPARLNSCLELISNGLPGYKNKVVLESLANEINMVNWAPLPMNDLHQFTQVIKQLQDSHSTTMKLFNSDIKNHASDTLEFKSFIKSFYSLNLSIEILNLQHFARVESSNLVTYQNPLNLLRNCIDQTKHQTISSFGFIPRFEVIQVTPTVKTFYIDSHLKYILMELFTNSVKAIKKTQSNPKIIVKVINGDEDLSIMVSDEAKGMPLIKFGNLFNLDSFVNRQGLAYCSMLAEYFGGDLEVCSMENLGTDVCLHVAKDANTTENVTIFK